MPSVTGEAVVAARQRNRHRMAWLFGLALLGAMVSIALHFSEGREFVRIAERAEPWWLLVAVVLQAGTYLAQGQIWRTVARAAGFPLSRSVAYRLSLAKLFVDQALPTGGISGTIVVGKALEARGMQRPAVMAGVVVINTAAYYVAYGFNLVAALLITAISYRVNGLLLLATLLFAAFGMLFAALLLALSGRADGWITKLGRLRALARLLRMLQEADPRLARDPALLLRAIASQTMIFWLDAATLWVLVLAMGETGHAGGIFAGYMFASVFRSIGLLPGGLGTFEAAAVLTLKLAGISLPAALAATLVFRGLSFWLPMLPGLWFSRAASFPRPPPQSSQAR